MDVRPEQLLERAKERFDLQDYFGAIHLLEELIAGGRAFADAHHLLGLAYHLVGQSDRALVSLDQAITLNPRYVEALIHRGVILGEMGRTEEAQQSFDAAHESGSEREDGISRHMASKLANSHAALGEAFRRLWGLAIDGEAIDAIPLARALQGHPLWPDANIGPILQECAEQVGAWERVTSYAKIVKADAIRRAVMRECQRGMQVAAESTDPQEAINGIVAALQAEQWTDNAGDAMRLGDLVDRLLDRDVANEAADDERDEVRLRTGIGGLDEVFRKLRPGYLAVLSGRPGEGKTTLMELICRHVAESTGPVLIWSGECPRDEMARRFLAMETLQPADVIGGRREEFMAAKPQLDLGARRLRSLPIWLYDERRPATFVNLEATARMVMREEGRPLALLAADRVELSPEGATAELNAAGFIRVHGFKSLGMRLHCRTLLLGQPSEKREREGRNRPSIRDLQYGAALKQDAQLILFLQREDYEREPGEAATGKGAVWILKFNDGRTGVVPIYFREELPAFFNDEHEYLVRSSGQ